jgi:hypothetical protein
VRIFRQARLPPLVTAIITAGTQAISSAGPVLCCRTEATTMPTTASAHATATAQYSHLGIVFPPLLYCQANLSM